MVANGIENDQIERFDDRSIRKFIMSHWNATIITLWHTIKVREDIQFSCIWIGLPFIALAALHASRFIEWIEFYMRHIVYFVKMDIY